MRPGHIKTENGALNGVKCVKMCKKKTSLQMQSHKIFNPNVILL